MVFLQIVELLTSAGWLTLLLTAFVAFLLLRWLLSGPKNIPPGPTGLPLLGYLPFLIKEPEKKLRDLSKKYGDVMTVNLFGVNVIHLGSYEAIYEALVSRGNEFVGRPKISLFDLVPARRRGVVFGDGDDWKIHRRFALQTLRDFGFGKLSLEARIQEIAEDVITVLEESKGRPIDVKDLLANSTANVICSLVFDRHFKLDDPMFVTFMSNLKEFVAIPTEFLLLNSFLIKVLPARIFPSLNTFKRTNKVFSEIVDNLITEHQETFDPNFLRDYVDVFLNEMKKSEDSGSDNENFFTRDRLTSITVDFIIAGTETTSNTLHWALGLLMYRPEMQKKIHEEIDEVIGRERLPGNKDRMKMPYTEAVIQEVLRISSLLPFSVFHSNPEEVQFRNYTIPKNSFILPNLWAIHHDPKYWPEPDKFDPTRFLNEDGRLIKKGSFYPFSLGKRVCLGESLALSETFIFLTSILQNFQLVPLDGASEPPLNPYFGHFRVLNSYNLRALKR